MFIRLLIFVVASLPSALMMAADGASRLDYRGYPNCILLENESTRVVISPAAGGRVLEYSLQGKNSLYLEEEATGKPYQPGGRASMSAGRFDIGPEKIIPRHPKLWSGDWKGEIAGKRRAILTSQKDTATGVQLTREFRLADTGSDLSCSQTILNVSKTEKQWCHWSRTFALGHGICLIPTSEFSRFPNHYVMYEGGDKINIKPEDPNIRRRSGFIEILAAPQEPKLGMDSKEGWFAYLMRNDIMFVKRFNVDPNAVYNEAAGLTISIWYPKERLPTVELEPIGPARRLKPGESTTFVEHWRLAAFPFPKSGETVDLKAVAKVAREEP